MSAWHCSKCGQEYWDTHECPKDPEAMLERIRALEQEVEILKERLDSLESK